MIRSARSGRALAALATVAMLNACAGSGGGVPTPTRTPTVPSSPTAITTSTAIVSATPTQAPTQVSTSTHTVGVAATPTATGTTAATPTATGTTAATPTSTSTAAMTPTASLTTASTATTTPTATATTSDPSQIDLLPPAVSASVDTLVRDIMATDFIPGLAVAIAQNGQTVLAKAYGYAECATPACVSGTALQANTPLEMGSVTKSFTTVGLLRIYDNPALNTSNLGMLNLTAPISQYLDPNPEFTLPQQWDNITLQDLLSMSSGIMDFGSNTMTWPEILEDVGTMPLLFSPGTGYCYSNPGFMLVGAVIQQLAQMPYAQFMQEQVFTPCLPRLV